jgi:hydroxymethylbilane synthase
MKKIILGTRGSELARAQTNLVIERLGWARPELEIECKIIKTRGDDPTASADQRAGRKGLFSGELERALLEHEIDLAVHSAKDLPSSLTTGTQIGAVLERAPIDDVLITKNGSGKLDCFKQSSSDTLASLPEEAIVATGSVRRQHQLRWRRPGIEIAELRGNVPTRLRKLIENNWDGIVLARAGLERLGIQVKDGAFGFEEKELFAVVLSREIFLPAGGQGVIAIQSRADDSELKSLLNEIDHPQTHTSLRAEREFLRLLNADCNQPVGVFATIDESTMIVRAQVFDPERTEPKMARVEGHAKDAEKLAAELFEMILKR